ncbi:MAG: hypothetical protein ACREYF_20675 [Gammaproteobacteria bacterium]
MSAAVWSKRLFRWGNLLPLLACPVIIWGFDLLVHLIPTSFLGGSGAIIFLTVSLPAIGALSIVWMYKYLGRDLLPPEIPAIVGLLYSQATYMFVLKAAVEGAAGAFNFSDWLVLTATVPFSTLIISTYDGTLAAVPLTVLCMVLGGYFLRNKGWPSNARKAQSVKRVKRNE